MEASLKKDAINYSREERKGGTDSNGREAQPNSGEGSNDSHEKCLIVSMNDGMIEKNAVFNS